MEELARALEEVETYRESLRDIEVNLRAQADCAASRSSTIMSDCFWPVAGAAVIEIVATSLTFKLQMSMSGMEQLVL